MINSTNRFIIRGLCILSVVINACSHSAPGRQFTDIPLAEGDLVFRKGIGAKTQAVLQVDSLGIYSHSGIVVVQNGVFKVVHITPGERKEGETGDKIKAEPINEFWSEDRAQTGAVYRLKNNLTGSQAARQALRMLGKGILFDHDYELSDTTLMYCTELVWYVYKLAGTDISFGKRSILNVPLYSGTYILPSDIYRNKEFQLIYKF